MELPILKWCIRRDCISSWTRDQLSPVNRTASGIRTLSGSIAGAGRHWGRSAPIAPAARSGTHCWPVWKNVGPNDRYFPVARRADRDFWLSAYDGRLAKMLVRFVEDAKAALNAAGLLEAIRTRHARAGG